MKFQTASTHYTRQRRENGIHGMMWTAHNVSKMHSGVEWRESTPDKNTAAIASATGSTTRSASVPIGVRANIHLGGQAEFFPNGEHKMFVTQPPARGKNNNELLQCLFLTFVEYYPMNVSFVNPPEMYVRKMDTCSVRGDTVSQTNVLSFARINVVYLPELGGQLPPPPWPPVPYAYECSISVRATSPALNESWLIATV